MSLLFCEEHTHTYNVAMASHTSNPANSTIRILAATITLAIISCTTCPVAAQKVIATTSNKTAAQQTTLQDQINSAITRSLPYIKDRGEWWIQKNDCVSCHRVSMMTWSFTQARNRGFKINTKKHDEWIDWSLEQLLSKREEDDDLVGSRNLEGLAHLVISSKSDKKSRHRTNQCQTRCILQAFHRVNDRPSKQRWLMESRRPTPFTKTSERRNRSSFNNVDRHSPHIER